MKHKTVGAHALELMKKEHEAIAAYDMQQAMLKDYTKHLEDELKKGLTTFEGDFYIVVIAKKEKLMRNVIRNYFLSRISCPTPDYDQTVWFADREAMSLNLLWVIPDRETCYQFLLHKNDILETDLLRHVLAFEDGTLYRECKRRNNEKVENNSIET